MATGYFVDLEWFQLATQAVDFAAKKKLLTVPAGLWHSSGRWSKTSTRYCYHGLILHQLP